MARILFLAHRIPYPPNKGDKIRSWHILEHLASCHSVDLACFIDDPRDRVHRETLRAICHKTCFQQVSGIGMKLRALTGLVKGLPLSVAAYPKRKIRDFVALQNARASYDLIFVFSGAMVACLDKQLISSCPVWLDLVDVDSEKWAAYAQTSPFPLSAIYAREARTLARFEAEAAHRSNIVSLVSDSEVKCFKSIGDNRQLDHVVALENGVDTVRFDPDMIKPIDNKGRQTVIFSGAMTYRPNIEAVLWFHQYVWPIILQQRPAAEFIIVGGPVDADIQALNHKKNTRVLGYVDKIEPYLAGCDVAVAPLLTARGIQNKVLEAMAMARPVVATQKAFEGIKGAPGTDLLVADTVNDFADSVVSLLGDQEKRHKMGALARQCVIGNHSWGASLAFLDQQLSTTMEWAAIRENNTGH